MSRNFVPFFEIYYVYFHITFSYIYSVIDAIVQHKLKQKNRHRKFNEVTNAFINILLVLNKYQCVCHK